MELFVSAGVARASKPAVYSRLANGRKPMAALTRRAILRGSMGLAAGSVLACPFIANAAATTATVWWVQGFAPQEDDAFKKLVADYEKASGNHLDHSIVPFAPLR